MSALQVEMVEMPLEKRSAQISVEERYKGFDGIEDLIRETKMLVRPALSVPSHLG